MLDELMPTIEHIQRINETIERLKEAKREAVAQLQAAASRHRSHYDSDVWAADRLWAAMVADDIPYRGYILRAVGWNAGNLKQILRSDHPECSTLPGAGAPHVYLLLDGHTVVYVGQSTNVRARIRQHLKERDLERLKIFDSWQVIRCVTDHEMSDLEAVLIQQHRPRFNVRTEQRPVPTGGA